MEVGEQELRSHVGAGLVFMVFAALVVVAVFAVLIIRETGGPQTGSTPATYGIAQFDELSPGMTKAEVRAVVGPGVKTVEQTVAGYHGEAFSYQNADGSNMLLEFQDGILITKAQFGLQ